MMHGHRTYLDYNATAPLRPCAREAVVAALEAVGNPSSIHEEGRRVRRIVEEAREKVAALVGARPVEVVFTSGATEANNWVLRGGWDAVVVSRIEHDAVLEPARDGGAHCIEVGADASGMAEVAAIGDALLRNPNVAGRVLVSLQMANNETGVVQPVQAVAQFCREHGVAFHTDAVQAAGRLPIRFGALGADFLSLSSHKIGGPMGVGALVIHAGIELPPLIVGGGQERKKRSGTENVPGIAGFGAAAEAALADLDDIGRIGRLRARIEARVREISPHAVVVGEGAERLANTSLIALPGQSAATQVIKFDLAGIAVSSGAACSSGKVGASHVLEAMRIGADISRSAVRVSLGWGSSEADVEAFLTAWRAMAGSHQRAVA
jgi:cysteine desulfurase